MNAIQSIRLIAHSRNNAIHIENLKEHRARARLATAEMVAFSTALFEMAETLDVTNSTTVAELMACRGTRRLHCGKTVDLIDSPPDLASCGGIQ